MFTTKSARAVAAVIAVALLAGCAPAAAEPGTTPDKTPSAEATQSPTLKWIQSDAFKICRELYESVPGFMGGPQRTCQAMARERDVDELIATFSDPAQVDQMRVDLQAQVQASPAPTAPAPPTPHVISEQARHVLDTNLGAAFAAVPELKDQYCTFSDAMLTTTAKGVVEMYRDITVADVVAYVNEVCGR